MKRPQWIVSLSALAIVILIFAFARTTPTQKSASATENQQHSSDDGHDHTSTSAVVSIDTILAIAKKQLKTEQIGWLSTLENSITRNSVKNQLLPLYHQLSHFWKDSARIFEPYAWYEAEAARLENSEKSLTFAAQQFLDNLQNDEVPERRKWKALQAKELFERSLKINPDNDSSKVGLGATYLFGGLSDTPMEGILKIREVVEKDSSNVYAQIMLGKGSLLSGQYDKAKERFLKVTRLEPGNLDAALLLAEVYERTGDKQNAVSWYQKSLSLVKQEPVRKAIELRIAELKK